MVGVKSGGNEVATSMHGNPFVIKSRNVECGEAWGRLVSWNAEVEEGERF